MLKYRSWGPPTRVLDFVGLSRQKIIQPAAAEISPKVLRGASRCDDTPNPTTKYRPNPSPQLVWAPLYAPALPRGPPLHHLNCGSSVPTKKVFLSAFWAGLRFAPRWFFLTFPPAAISPLKSTPHSPSSPRPVQPQTTTPPTLTLPATPRYLPPPSPCPIFEWCFVPTVIKRSFNRYFSPIVPSALHQIMSSSPPRRQRRYRRYREASNTVAFPLAPALAHSRPIIPIDEDLMG